MHSFNHNSYFVLTIDVMYTSIIWSGHYWLIGHFISLTYDTVVEIPIQNRNANRCLLQLINYLFLIYCDAILRVINNYTIHIYHFCLCNPVISKTCPSFAENNWRFPEWVTVLIRTQVPSICLFIHPAAVVWLLGSQSVIIAPQSCMQCWQWHVKYCLFPKIGGK